MNALPCIAALTLLVVGEASRVNAQDAIDHGHRHDHTMPEASPQENVADPYRSPHVPPAAPSQSMGPLSAHEMNDIMEMNDADRFGKLIVNRAEWIDDGLGWDMDAWYGTDLNKLWIRSTGEQRGDNEAFNVDALWDRVIARWWSVQGGVQYEEVNRHSRTSLALGLQGLAPQWFEIEATAYLRDDGTASAHGEVDYDLLLTQRLILQPSAELTINSANDRKLRTGSGLSEIEIGLRLRYEIRRELAPYVGVRWVRSFGNTADFDRSDGHEVSDVEALAGLRVWF